MKDKKRKAYLEYYEQPTEVGTALNNNNWIKIESKEDLPKIDGYYWVVEENDQSPKIMRYVNNPYTKTMNDDWWLKYITYYQRIEVPKSPIY